jgi:WD repeat-containing protein 23
LFDTSNWSISKSIRAREVEWAVLDVDYSADKKWLAYCTWSDKIQLVNSTGAVETHQAFQVRQSTRGRFGLFSLRFSPQSTEVIGGSSDGGVYLCDLVADKTIRFEGHEDDVNAVTFLNDGSGNVFLSGSDDHFVRVWDKRADEKCVGMFAGHSSGITSLDSRDDRYCCSNSKDQSIKLWDLRTLSGACRKRERARRGPDIDYRGPAVLSNLLRTLCSPDDESVITYRGSVFLWCCVFSLFVEKKRSSSHANALSRFLFSCSNYGFAFYLLWILRRVGENLGRFDRGNCCWYPKNREKGDGFNF